MQLQEELSIFTNIDSFIGLYASTSSSAFVSDLLFSRLSLDAIATITSYLWVQDCLTLQCCSKSFNNFIVHSNIASSLLKSCLLKTGRHVTESRQTALSHRHNISLLRSISPYPNRVDYRSLFWDKQFRLKESAPGVFNKIQYVGDIGHNNVVFGNDHFPIMPINNRFQKFTKTCVVRNECIPFLSLVAYFEVIIDPVSYPIPDSASNSSSHAQEQVDPCIVVGLATLRFPSNGAMPGWDENSFGYHGDDGHFFHGQSIGQRFTANKIEYDFVNIDPSEPVFESTTRFETRFGAGDTVGCGILYPPLTKKFPEIFFTLNGRYLGKKKIFIPLQLPFFPVVGCDCHDQFIFNFNDSPQCKPFKFDVVKFEKFWVDQKYPPETVKAVGVTDYAYFDHPLVDCSSVLAAMESPSLPFQSPKLLSQADLQEINENRQFVNLLVGRCLGEAVDPYDSEDDQGTEETEEVSNALMSIMQRPPTAMRRYVEYLLQEDNEEWNEEAHWELEVDGSESIGEVENRNDEELEGDAENYDENDDFDEDEDDDDFDDIDEDEDDVIEVFHGNHNSPAINNLIRMFLKCYSVLLDKDSSSGNSLFVASNQLHPILHNAHRNCRGPQFSFIELSDIMENLEVDSNGALFWPDYRPSVRTASLVRDMMAAFKKELEKIMDTRIFHEIQDTEDWESMDDLLEVNDDEDEDEYEDDEDVDSNENEWESIENDVDEINDETMDFSDNNESNANNNEINLRDSDESDNDNVIKKKRRNST